MRTTRGIFAAVMVAAVLGVVAATAGGTNTPPPSTGHDPVTICHKPGTPAQKQLTVDDDSVELTGHLGHGDTLGPCQGEPPEECPPGTVPDGEDCVTPPPVDQCETEPGVQTEPCAPVDACDNLDGVQPPGTDCHPTPPPGHQCTFVGADKDGGHDKYGGTNDDCAPFPDPPKPTATPTPDAPPATVPPAVTPTPDAPVVSSTPPKTIKPKPKAKKVPKPDKPVVIVSVKKKPNGVVKIKTSDGKTHTGIMGSG